MAEAMQKSLKLAALVLLTSCARPDHSPPSDLDDACSIVRERPAYLQAMQATQSKWGIPVAVQMATIYQESKFKADARTPFRYALGVIPMGRQSSAYGYAQALDATWDEYRHETGNRRAKRNRIEDAVDFIGWYMNKSAQRNGIAKTDMRNQYLAYHDGHTGFARGTYRRKSWLVRIADELTTRANTYHAQLISCKRG